MVTVAVTLGVSVYMVLAPARWVGKLMQLTWLAGEFRWFILGLGVVYLAVAWVGEEFVLSRASGGSIIHELVGSRIARLTGGDR